MKKLVIAAIALLALSAAAWAPVASSWACTALSAAVALLIGSWLVFVKGLELQFPFLPVFLTR
jgi:hypothetical protein